MRNRETNRSNLCRHAVASSIAVACLALALIGAANAGGESSSQFTEMGPAHSFSQAAGVNEYLFSAKRGPTAFDRIALHRISRGPHPPAHPGIVVLYLPGTFMNGEVAIDDPRYSMPLYLAMHGVDFWALDYRTHFIPPTTPQAELTELAGWTNELFESDIDAAASFVRATTGAKRIFVSGFSRGVAFGYLYAAAHPNNVAGLLLFDGSVGGGHPGSPPPGIYAEDVSGRHLTWEKRDALLKLVISNPAAPAPIPQYKNAADNLAHVVYDSSAFGGKGALANPIGGFSDPSVLAHLLIRFDRYWPIVQDYGDSFTPALAASLARSRIPVLASSSTNFGPDWPRKVARSAAATGSSDTRVITLAGWGHLDVICGTHSQREVFAPAAGWLTRHSKGAETTARSSGDAATGSR